jgi:hypothetical protein
MIMMMMKEEGECKTEMRKIGGVEDDRAPQSHG